MASLLYKSILICLFAIAHFIPSVKSSNAAASAVSSANASVTNNVHLKLATGTSTAHIAPIAQAAASAAAAAALGLDQTKPSKVEVIHNQNTSSKQNLVSAVRNSVISVTIRPTQTTLLPTASEHRHSIKKIGKSDKLHKFDLFIDPVCEQIARLTDKQVVKVFAQLRQFAHLVSAVV